MDRSNVKFSGVMSALVSCIDENENVKEDSMRRLWMADDLPVGELAAKILQSSQAVCGDDATVAVVRLRGTSA